MYIRRHMSRARGEIWSWCHVTHWQSFGAEMSMCLPCTMFGKSNFSKRNQTAVLDIDNRELQKRIRKPRVKTSDTML